MKLRTEIERVININNAEAGSNTPDFILAEFLTDCLAAFDKATKERHRWYHSDGDQPELIPADPSAGSLPDGHVGDTPNVSTLLPLSPDLPPLPPLPPGYDHWEYRGFAWRDDEEHMLVCGASRLCPEFGRVVFEKPIGLDAHYFEAVK